MVIPADAAAAMRSVLAIAAGVDGPDAMPPLVGGSATVTADWDPERVADHTGVTATFGAPLAPTLTMVPDALVGRCWPAVFAAIGGAVTETGFPVVEGLLVELTVENGPAVGAEVLRTLDAAAITVTGMALREPSLDDVFLNLTGHKAEDEPADDSTSGRRSKRKASA